MIKLTGLYGRRAFADAGLGPGTPSSTDYATLLSINSSRRQVKTFFFQISRCVFSTLDELYKSTFYLLTYLLKYLLIYYFITES